MPERNDQLVNVRLPERLKDRLEKEAKAAGIPLSELIRDRLDDAGAALSLKDGVTNEQLKRVIAKAIVEVQRKSR